ncbi:hypothetical protein QUB70_02325 [Microcoleus sp. A003_D6]|uniref:hypothetical protein n=1 Tax=Microcoleus sp. A003_D6 TaxID=3055266 RepID=UPI002FD68DD2
MIDDQRLNISVEGAVLVVHRVFSLFAPPSKANSSSGEVARSIAMALSRSIAETVSLSSFWRKTAILTLVSFFTLALSKCDLPQQYLAI